MKITLLFKNCIFLFVILLINCNSNNKRIQDIVDVDELEKNTDEKFIADIDTIGEGLPIFYNMYLSVELSSLFDTIGTAFNSELLNNTNNLSYYNTSTKKALNIGVYAVDLSYIRVFNQIELNSKYFNTMQKLAEELGIPSDYFAKSAERLEINIDNRDSLISLANEIYFTTKNYLEENEQYSAVAKIILGGWIEAMYIALDVAKMSENFEIYERIAEQTYSLMHLIEMLSSYKNDEIITGYLAKIKKLEQPLNDLQIAVEANYSSENLNDKDVIQKLEKKSEKIAEKVNIMRDEITG